MRRLYHFQMSVFSKRTRLALAHKGLEVELKEGREDPSALAEARALSPIRTMPVFVEEDGKVLGDSNAIAQYLELAYPDRPRLFPSGAADAHQALAIMTAVDVAMNALVDLGTRAYELRHDAAWPAMRDERMARAQEAIDWVATQATRPYLAGAAWSAADMWAYSAVAWVAGLPARVGKSPAAAPIVSLGLKLPEPLVAWTKQHVERADVRAVYA